jgi:hypothetical protein
MKREDDLDRLVADVLREEVEGLPYRTPPGVERRWSRVASTAGRIVVAAAAAACIVLPWFGIRLAAPSARNFAQIHARLDSGDKIVAGLTNVSVFLDTHFTGGLKDE